MVRSQATGLQYAGRTDDTTAGAEAGAKSFIAVRAEHGKPDIPPRGRQTFPQGALWECGQRNAGESQGRPVIGRIGVAVSTLPRKRADFQHGQSLRENL